MSDICRIFCNLSDICPTMLCMQFCLLYLILLCVKTLRLKQDKTKCINVNNFQYGRELPQSKPVPHLQTNRPQQQPARCQCRPSQPRCFGKPFKSIVISLIELKAHATLRCRVFLFYCLPLQGDAQCPVSTRFVKMTKREVAWGICLNDVWD